MTAFEKIMDLVIKPAANSPIFNCMLSVSDFKNNYQYKGVKGTFHDAQISPDMLFKTGSMTKPFTASIVLQLMEEGLLKLDDSFFDLLNNETRKALTGLHIIDDYDHSSLITVKHLLQHQSGLCDYFNHDDQFISYVISHPTQSWTWRTVMEKYFEMGLNKKPVLKPGNGFYYSDTNYLLLAVLIEHLAEKPLHQLFEERLFKPFSLNETYLEFYQSPKSSVPVVYPYYGAQSLENINTSFDWGGGGLISGLNDLSNFMHLLANGHIFKKEETLKLMLQFLPTDSANSKRSLGYGLGLQKKEFNGYSFIGHNSAYGSMMFYQPKLNISIVLTLNQSAATLKAEWLIINIIKELLKAK